MGKEKKRRLKLTCPRKLKEDIQYLENDSIKLSIDIRRLVLIIEGLSLEDKQIKQNIKSLTEDLNEIESDG